MKTLFVIHYPIFGGPHNQATRLTGLLLNYGWETIVLLPDEPGMAARRLTEGGRDCANATPSVSCDVEHIHTPEICFAFLARDHEHPKAPTNP